MWEETYKGDLAAGVITERETYQPTAYKLLAQSLDITAGNAVEDEFKKFINSTPH